MHDLDFSKSPSSLAVGRFAAKKGLPRSPRGRLVASLCMIVGTQLQWRYRSYNDVTVNVEQRKQG